MTYVLDDLLRVQSEQQLRQNEALVHLDLAVSGLKFQRETLLKDVYSETKRWSFEMLRELNDGLLSTKDTLALQVSGEVGCFLMSSWKSNYS